VSIEVLHRLVSYIIHVPRDVVGEDQINAFLDTLRRDFPKEHVPAVVAPLLYPDAHDIPIEK